MTTVRPGRRRREERGAVAVLAALVSFVLLVVAALVVDLGTTWSRRGELQRQADQAAVFAAQALPATDAASRLRVARRVAHYVACHAVQGQRRLTPGLPACPSSPSSPDLDAFAQSLLDESLVTFPSSTQVQVVTPDAEVRYAFAGVTGVEDTVQRKAATAKVSSPGDLLPIGLSLQCLATVVNSAGLGAAVDGVLPLSYVTPGASSSTGVLDPDAEPPFVAWQPPYTGNLASEDVTVSSPVLTDGLLTVRVGSPALGTVSNLLGGARVVFKRGGTTVGPVAAAGLTVGGGELVAAPPAEVLATPGIWHVKVKLAASPLDLLGLHPRWSEQDATFPVYPEQTTVVGRLVTALDGILDLKDFLACGRLLDSPRVQDGGTPALTRNLQEGIDHALTPNEALVQALATQDLGLLDGSAQNLSGVLGGAVAGVLANPAYGLLGCAGTQFNRLDTVATWQATVSAGAPPANCVRIRSDAAAEQELTDGLLKDHGSSPTEPGYGRLSCQRDGACTGATTTLPGFQGSYNNDGFADFLTDGPNTVLESNLFYALDTYLLPRVPLLTPSDTIRSEIYSSPRFGWVPVLSYVDLNSPGSVDHPVLTFRPVFLDNGSARDLKVLGLDVHGVVDGLGCHLSDSVDSALATVLASLGSLGGVLGSVTGALGLGNIQSLLCQGHVDQALGMLGSALGTDMGAERAGLVLRNGRLEAARFMTVAPGALPPVPDDYDGPLVDYVGVGPKVIRLVR